MWYNGKYIYVSISNCFNTMRKLKGVFKPLSLCFMYGKDSKLVHPFTWVSKPHPIQIISSDVGWKDKYDSPRYEDPPYIWIHLFGYSFIWFWELKPPHYDMFDVEQFWEQALWYLYYYRNTSYGCLEAPDISKAKKSWPWEDYETKKSTWSDKYLEK